MLLGYSALKKNNKLVSWVWHKNASGDETLVSVEYPFIDITPSSTLTQSGSTCYGPM